MILIYVYFRGLGGKFVCDVRLPWYMRGTVDGSE